MIKFLRNCCDSKRECVTFLVTFFWIILGIIAIYNNTDLNHLAAYFISLTGFITAYIFGESIRKSKKSSIFLSGKSSKRESITYITLFIWLAAGILGIINDGDLLGMSAYFAALTPFIGSYIIGETYKEENKELSNSDDTYQINS